MPRRRKPSLGAFLIVSLAAGGWAARLQAVTVDIPNASFESPTIRVAPYATATIHNWLKAPPPPWWTQEGYTLLDWLNTAGVFYNVPGTTRIDNIDGLQAAFVFATPGVELYQDLDATYEIGRSYQLTAGFQGGGMGMPLGIPIELRLYYRNDDGGRVTIGAAEMLNTTDESRPHPKRLDDCRLRISPVLVADRWAGRKIGIQIASTVSLETAGGYWRVDNVRLAADRVPADFDGDGDVDGLDLEHLKSCASGPAIPQNDPACRDARLDADEDVDQGDFGVFQRCFSGEGIAANFACVE